MNTPNDEMISFLQRIASATPGSNDGVLLKNEEDFPYYHIAFDKKYLERDFGNIKRLRLTDNGRTALAHLINIADHQGREIERFNRETEQHVYETERHNRERRLIYSNVASAIASVISTAFLIITLGFMIYGKNQVAILEQPIGIKGNIQITTPSEIVSDNTVTTICKPCEEIHCVSPCTNK
jgi:hypothetical protein